MVSKQWHSSDARARRKLLIIGKRLTKWRPSPCSDCSLLNVGEHFSEDVNSGILQCQLHQRTTDQRLKMLDAQRKGVCWLNRRYRKQILSHRKRRKFNDPKSFTCYEISETFVRRVHGAATKSPPGATLSDYNTCGSRVQEIGVLGLSGSPQRRMMTAWNFGHPTCFCPNCGAMVWYEERCKKMSKSASVITS